MGLAKGNPGASLFALLWGVFDWAPGGPEFRLRREDVMNELLGRRELFAAPAEAKHQWHTKWLLMFVF